MTVKKANSSAKPVKTIKEAVQDVANQGQTTMPPETDVESGKQALDQALAEMIFYHGPAGPLTTYSSLTDEEKKNLLKEARSVLLCFDKMNLMVVPKYDRQAARLKDKNGMIDIIRTFMQNLNKPKDLHEYFPIEELVERLITGRITVKVDV